MVVGREDAVCVVGEGMGVMGADHNTYTGRFSPCTVLCRVVVLCKRNKVRFDVSVRRWNCYGIF